MVVPDNARASLQSVIVAAAVWLCWPAACLPQNSPPAPAAGALAGSARAAGSPAPGGSRSAPAPGDALPAPSRSTAPGQATRGGSYTKLPLNPGNALARLDELRNAMPNLRPHDFQDMIGEYCDWLSDLADAHWKLAQTFAKADATKAQSESEKQLCLKFGGLRRQAMLLKAQFLISQRRYPEALAPLVDIVSAEPRSETGQNAYRLLQEIGFSQQVEPTTPKTAPAPAVH